jgi:hypothetical protein
MPDAVTTSHRWRFFRAGGFDQAKVETGADLAHLDQLDQKLWVALACPIAGLEFDAQTLALIDTDKDGRIRAPELIAAARWATGLLKNPDDLLKSSPMLPLSAINDGNPAGKELFSSARQILINLGKKDAVAITLEDTADTAKIFAQTNFNGDGIVPVESAPDDATKSVITDIMACLGTEMDRSGKPGVNQARVDQFFAEAQAYADWWKKAEGDGNILPLGEATAAASAAVRAVKTKVDDYFARCRLAAFDARAVAALNREEKEFLAFAAKDLTITAAEIAGLPLARIEADKPLPLEQGVNPAWMEALATLNSAAVKPLLGERTSLIEADWTALNTRLAAFENWSAGKVGVVVEKLGLQRLREILAGPAKETIANLIAQDKALEPEANAIDSVDKLIRLHHRLHLLCTNFVNFKDFYSRRQPAIFQAGRLYMDQRSCDLCLPVADAGKHALMAGLAGVYLAYCDCVRKGTGEIRQIVAAFTDGGSDNLMIGRNGIFYDRRGLDWDATITKIIENPISIRQAFWLPYKKFLRFIEQQVAKRAATADAAASSKLEGAVPPPAAAPKPAEPKKFDLALVTGMTVAATALSATLIAVVGMILGLKWWQYPLLVIGVMLLISGPSMIIAYLTLRKRNLGPLLDANGWAVNAPAKINVPLGRSLTALAKLPPGSQRNLVDPFAEKRKPWGLYIVLVVVLVLAGCWYSGKLDKVLPGKIKSTTVLGTNAPAYQPPPPVTNAPAAPPPPATNVLVAPQPPTGTSAPPAAAPKS